MIFGMHPGFGKLTLNMVWEQIDKILIGSGEIDWVEEVAKRFPLITVQFITRMLRALRLARPFWHIALPHTCGKCWSHSVQLE